MMSSNAKTKRSDADNSEHSKSVSSKLENDDKQNPTGWSDTTSSSTTNEPSSVSATVAATTIAVARHPTAQSGLPTLAAAAAATAPAAPTVEKKPRRAGFRDEFLPMVISIKNSTTHACLNPLLTLFFRLNPQLRVMLDRESQKDNTTVQWSTDGNSFIIMDQNQFEEVISTLNDI